MFLHCAIQHYNLVTVFYLFIRALVWGLQPGFATLICVHSQQQQKLLIYLCVLGENASVMILVVALPFFFFAEYSPAVV